MAIDNNNNLNEEPLESTIGFCNGCCEACKGTSNEDKEKCEYCKKFCSKELEKCPTDNCENCPDQCKEKILLLLITTMLSLEM